MAIEAVDPRARGLRTRSRDEAVGAVGLARRLDWVLLGATLARRRLRRVGDRRDHAPRPRRKRGVPPGRSTRRSAAVAARHRAS